MLSISDAHREKLFKFSLISVRRNVCYEYSIIGNFQILYQQLFKKSNLYLLAARILTALISSQIVLIAKSKVILEMIVVLIVRFYCFHNLFLIVNRTFLDNLITKTNDFCRSLLVQHIALCQAWAGLRNNKPRKHRCAHTHKQWCCMGIELSGNMWLNW